MKTFLATRVASRDAPPGAKPRSPARSAVTTTDASPWPRASAAPTHRGPVSKAGASLEKFSGA